MARVLVSAFEPFGSNATNPTRDALRAFRADGRLGADVATVILPVTFDGAGTILLARIAREAPAACLMFGLAVESQTMRIEQFAHNEADTSRSDNTGFMRAASTVIPGAPPRLEARGSMAAMEKALREAGAPVTLSQDAGRFVCNATYFRVLAVSEVPVAMFIHVPPGETMGGSIPDAEIARWMYAAIAAV